MSLVFIVLPISFIVTVGVGSNLIPYLQRKQVTQTIIDYGPTWHKFKEGTPIMGGLMIIAGSIISMAFYISIVLLSNKNSISSIFNDTSVVHLVYGLLMALGFSSIGFFDDYIKVTHRRNLGLTPMEKIICQAMVALTYMLALYFTDLLSTEVRLPFLGMIDFGITFYPLCLVGIIFIVNSANLTDGVDGLVSSVTFMCALSMFICSVILKENLNAAFSLALAGACLGFLVFNNHPAKIFMGDTGSMFLGACVISLAFGLDYPCILLFSGFIYVVESVTVIIQQTSKRIFHKKVFKMTPIHHHFEMCKMSEVDITMAFTCISAVGAILSVFLVIAI